ncbi:hypothetical protein FEM48_Zijuj02G0112000 [Ziziphus jujuba var. spinosa]|uniref:Wound-induced protein 1 n=1 Tax=Ziziphus jujuba var. spinosa TaxID=714518 RepID=A0A978VVE3_ZIZJJ|nr:hypothetical protein FEM48_Zijuj02G0112000 [Ziziphus jujuba var. spinosa]
MELTLLRNGNRGPISLLVRSTILGPVKCFECRPNQKELRKLANLKAKILEEEEDCNTKVLTVLYEALSSKHGRFNEVHRFLSSYIEWWFHGPPSHSHRHLKRLLTGSPSDDLSFAFVPLSVVAFGSTVLVEGYDQGSSVSWVHAWTLNEGIITQVREYYNTSVTVTRFEDSNGVGAASSPEIRSRSGGGKCESVWQSKLSDESVPGLVLAL